MNDDELIKLKYAILEELHHIPTGYMQPERALRSSLALSVCPRPPESVIDAALRRLEADGHIHCEVDDLGIKRWCICAAGRAVLLQP